MKGWRLCVTPLNPTEVTLDDGDNTYLPSGYYFEIRSPQQDKTMDAKKLKETMESAFKASGLNKPQMKLTNMGAWVGIRAVSKLHHESQRNSVAQIFGACSEYPDPYQAFIKVVTQATQDKGRNRT